MKLKTIRQRFMGSRNSGYDFFKAALHLLQDKSWSDDRVEALCECLTQIETPMRIAFSRGMYDSSGFMTMIDELGTLPEWIKYRIIMHDPELGEFLGPMSPMMENIWILIK